MELQWFLKRPGTSKSQGDTRNRNSLVGRSPFYSLINIEPSVSVLEFVTRVYQMHLLEGTALSSTLLTNDLRLVLTFFSSFPCSFDRSPIMRFNTSKILNRFYFRKRPSKHYVEQREGRETAGLITFYVYIFTYWFTLDNKVNCLDLFGGYWEFYMEEKHPDCDSNPKDRVKRRSFLLTRTCHKMDESLSVSQTLSYEDTQTKSFKRTR